MTEQNEPTLWTPQLPWPGPDKKKAAENNGINALLKTYLFHNVDGSGKS